MKTSVIIPIYNVEKYLRQCLDSVFQQDINDYEVICINDGSTDACASILDEYEQNNSNMILVTISNHGVGYARNLGIRLAKGLTCCFMDPDDLYPDKDILRKMYNILEKTEIKICGGSAKIMRDDKIVEPNEREKLYVFPESKIVDYIDYQWSYGFWRFMYNTEFLKKNNIFFPEYSRHQDPPFMVNTMIAAKKFYALKDFTYIYRANSKKMIYTYQKTKDCLLGITDVLRMSKEHNLSALNKLSVEHINTWLCMPIYSNILQGNDDLRELLDIAKNEVIDSSEDGMEFLPEIKVKEYVYAKKKEKTLLNLISGYEIVILYGAGNVGRKVADFLLTKEIGTDIIFAVSDKNKINENVYRGIEIKDIRELMKYRDSAYVLVTTMKNIQGEICDTLQRLEFKHMEAIDYEEFRLYALV